MNSGQITVENGVISYTLDKEYTGNGTERIGYGNAPNGPQPHVTFYAKQAQHGAASLDQGKPVFKSIVFMRLQHPGERDVYEQPARPSDAERFPREYRHYCSGRVGIPDGAPLQVLFPNHEDVVSNLQYHRIYTVEQLANLSDTALQNIGMGGLEWQGKARRWLDAVKGGGGFAQLEENQRKLQVDNTRLRDQNQQMTSQLQALTNQIAQLTNAMIQQGGVIPAGGLVHQGFGNAPGLAAFPTQQPARMMPNGFAAPGPGELGADDHVPHVSAYPDQAPAGVETPIAELLKGDTFADDLTQPEQPATGRPRRRQ
jgi:hypothetical protein